MYADVHRCTPLYTAVVRFCSPQKNMPRADVDVPDARKLGIGPLPVIPAGTMIPARGIPFDRGRVRVAHPTSASVRQCPPILSAAVRRKREIDSPSGVHQEGRADGANGWIRTGTTVPDSDSRGAAAARALPAQNRKTYIWSGGHWRTSADIGGHSPRFGCSVKKFGIVKNCFVLQRITRCLDIVPNTRSIGKVFLIDFRPAAQGIFRLAAL